MPVASGIPSAGAVAAVSAEVMPLSQRAAAMMAYRVVEVAVLVVIGSVSTSGSGSQLATGVVFLVFSAALSLGVLVPNRTLAVRSFGLSLLLDGLYLQVQHETLGHSVSVDVVLAANLVAVCLLASFRTGLKIGVWQSLLMMMAARGEHTLLFPAPKAFAGVDREDALLVDLVLLWLVVVTTAAAGAVNERELRRRRYDAEALARLAGDLHGDEHPRDVASRLVSFVVHELDAPRALVCRAGGDGPVLMSGHGLAPAAVHPPATEGAGHDRSALLSAASADGAPTLALRLDPARDAWLASRVPGARNLVALALAHGDEPVWLVMEHRGGARRPGGRRAGRAQRRVMSSVAQAAATASLAMSRAELLERAERAAATDALTGVANRRTFDSTLARLCAGWESAGRPFTLVLVDVDHFKSINDRFGHQVGDETLQAVARVLAGVAGPGDVAARYGGEEFALLLPDVDVVSGAAVAERARLALHDLERPVRVSASFGVAAVPDDARTASALVGAADAALLRAKGMGRDRVVIAGPGAPRAAPPLPAEPR